MYKKIAFEIHEDDENRQKVIDTILTTGYPFMDITEKEVIDGVLTVSFAVNKNDLQDLRHEVEILNNVGYCVKEVRP